MARSCSGKTWSSCSSAVPVLGGPDSTGLLRSDRLPERPAPVIRPAIFASRLTTRPVALYPATSESEKNSYNQVNRATGQRVQYLKVDADTGDEVPNEASSKATRSRRTNS